MTDRLAYLCSSESWGGLEMNHLKNAVWMKARGHMVIVICVKNSRFHKEAEAANIPIITINKHRKYYDFKVGKALLKILKSQAITHLLIRSNRDMSIAAYVKSKLRDQIHTSYFMEMQLGVKKKSLLHTIRYKGIDLWSCPLPWLENQVRTMTRFKNEIALIPSGIDLDQFIAIPDQVSCRAQLELPENVLLLGLLGRFDIQKGQLLLLEAMQKAKNKDFHVVLLGEPTFGEGMEYFDQMNSFIEEKKLKHRVHIRPYMSNPEIFYGAIDWFVMATKAETFGMVTLESLACGTPVLGSNKGGTAEILENEIGGVLFESMNSNDLSEKIDSIIDNKIVISPETLKSIARKYDHNLVCEMVEKHLKLG